MRVNSGLIGPDQGIFFSIGREQIDSLALRSCERKPYHNSACNVCEEQMMNLYSFTDLDSISLSVLGVGIFPSVIIIKAYNERSGC